MAGRRPLEALTAGNPPLFATTHWSVVLAAGESQQPETAVARESLCRTYWYPLYAYVRHRGHSPEDSQDLTQEFFCRLLQGNYLARVDPQKGKFRSFLLAAMNHFLANEWHRSQTLKRGGNLTFLPLDGVEAEERYRGERFGSCSPEEIYERAWAMALLERVIGRLSQETAATGQCAPFEQLKPLLIGERPSLSYSELALKLGTTEAALKMAVHRLRKRYAQLVHEEIAHTVPDPLEVEAELRHLRAVLSSGT